MSKIPQIPDPTSPQFGQNVKQWIEVAEGSRGPTFSLDRVVKVGDLLDADFINSLANYKFPITRTNSNYGYTGDTSAPRPPTNLVVTSEVFRNILTWDDPNSENFWYIEVYRAKVVAGAAAPTVGSAIKIASVPKTVESFVDTEVSITSYDHYYWIRAVSYAGIASLWQDGYIEGHTTINATIDSIMTTLKGADPDAWSSIVSYVADDRVLQGGKRYKCILANLNQVPPNVTYWEQSGILITGNIGGVNTVGIDGNLVVDDTILARCINVNDAFIGMTIQSTVFTTGSVGWQINKDGDVEFNSGVFRGTVIVGASSEVDWSYVLGTGKPDDDATVNATFYQAGIPTSLAIGDLWFDSDDKNKAYRAECVGADEIIAGEWVIARDTDIPQAIADALAAQAAADTAQTDATSALSSLTDIAADAKITPVEKLTLLPLWNGILAEKVDIDSEADIFGVSKTAYGTAYSALYGYVVTTLNTFGSMSGTTAITRATWDGHFETYYNAKIEILNAIATAAKTLADAAQADANTGITNAATAQAAADAAQSDATTGIADAASAQAELDDIAADAKVTPVEKLTAKQLWDAIVVEGTATTGTIPVQATAFSVSDVDFDTAYAALDAHLNAIAQDYTDCTEVDVPARVAVAASQLTITDLDCDEEVYVYKDFGVDYFGGDFEFQFSFNVSATATNSYGYLWGLANAVDDLRATSITNDLDCHVLYCIIVAGDCFLRFREYNGGSSVVSDVMTLSVSTDYYVTISRDESVGTYGTITLSVYTDSDRTVHATGSPEVVTLTEKQNFRYLYAMSAYKSGLSGKDISGTISNLTCSDLNVFSDMAATTNITRTTWDTKWKDYYDERTKLLNAIATAAKTLADTAQASADDLTDIFHNVSGVTWTEDSPAAGSLAWAGAKVTYKGTTYSITNDNTALKYIWWDFSLSTTTFQTSATIPTLNVGDFVVAINDGGSHIRVWGATIIDSGAILTDSLSAISANLGTCTAGIVKSSDDKIALDLDNKWLKVYDDQATPVLRVHLGYIP